MSGSQYNAAMFKPWIGIVKGGLLTPILSSQTFTDLPAEGLYQQKCC